MIIKARTDDNKDEDHGYIRLRDGKWVFQSQIAYDCVMSFQTKDEKAQIRYVVACISSSSLFYVVPEENDPDWVQELFEKKKK